MPAAPFRPLSLDHVALWTSDRGPLAGLLCERLGMHAIEETEAFTLLGVDAKLGKLTLFEAEGPRERGALERVALRVGDLDAASRRLPPGAERTAEGIDFEGPGGVPLALVERPGRDYDLDHVVLRLPGSEAAARGLARMGFERRDGVLAVGDRHVRIVEGAAADGGRPLLNHVALLVDSAREVREGAERAGIEVDEVKDAPSTFAVFLRGPAGVRVEYVEHKPGFALV